MLFGVLAIFLSQLLSTQGDYAVILEDVDVSVYSAEYGTEPDVFIDNDNRLSVNLSLTKAIPEGTDGRFSITGASMGEYVINTGIDSIMDLCEAFAEPILMGPIFRAAGFSAENCPPGVGIYLFEGYILQMETLPDDFPPNNYRATLEIIFEKQALLVINAFIKIS